MGSSNYSPNKLTGQRLTYKSEEHRLPHLVDVVILLDLNDPDATLRRFLCKLTNAILTSHIGTSLFRKKKMSISLGISLGFFR